MEDIRFVRCLRCQLGMRVRVKPGNPEALLMRYSETGEGLCADCAATLFLYGVEHIKRMIEGKREMLLWEPAQSQFATLMAAGHADAAPTEINWQRVYDNWDLPFPKQKRASRKQ